LRSCGGDGGAIPVLNTAPVVVEALERRHGLLGEVELTEPVLRGEHNKIKNNKMIINNK
jgi:hypothetical protein